jgi:hypothetical protein
MWQHHYLIHSMRMAELLAAAERERRWRRQDEANARPVPAQAPGRARTLVARAVASISRATAGLARRLDSRLDGPVAGDLGPERLLRDA